MTVPTAPHGDPARAALAGVRILDLTTVVFGPYATQILADYGADVIKIEPPAGDPMRQVGAAVEDGLGTLFLGFNRNKRSVVLDLKSRAGSEVLLDLVDGADVLVHSMRPAKAAALGLDPDTLCGRNSRLIHATLTGFGDGGEYAGRPAYDDIIQGLSGAADLVHRQTGQFRFLPTIAADKTAGQVAAHAVLAALFQRERTGSGQRLEVPMFETTASYLLAEHFQRGHLPDTDPDDGALGYQRALSPWRRPYATSDGQVCLMPYSDRHWERFFGAIGRPALAADPRFAGLGNRTRHVDELYRIIAETVAGEPTAHWLQLCSALDIPAAPVNRLEDLLDDPHLRSVGFFTELRHGGHRYRFPGNPVRLQRSRVPARMPPALGEHTAEVLRSAGLAEDRIAAMLDSPAAPTDQGKA